MNWSRHNQGSHHTYSESFLHVSPARKIVVKCWLKAICTRKVQGVSMKISKAIFKCQARRLLGQNPSLLLSCSAGNTGKDPLTGLLECQHQEARDLPPLWVCRVFLFFLGPRGLALFSSLWPHSLICVPLCICIASLLLLGVFYRTFIVIHVQYRNIREFK